MTFEEVDQLQLFFAESFISVSAVGQEAWEAARAKVNADRLPAEIAIPTYDDFTASLFHSFLRLIVTPHRPIVESDLLNAKALYRDMAIFSPELGALLDDRARDRGARETDRLKTMFDSAGHLQDPAQAGWLDNRTAELARITEVLKTAEKHSMFRSSFWAIATIAAGIVFLTALFMSMSAEAKPPCASSSPS